MTKCPLCGGSVLHVGMWHTECASPRSRCQNGVGAEQVTVWHAGMLLQSKRDGTLRVVTEVRPALIPGRTIVTLQGVLALPEVMCMPDDMDKWEHWSPT